MQSSAAMSTRALAIAAALGLAACFQGHDPGAVEIQATDCYTCHRTEFEAAGVISLGSVGCLQPVAPVHVGNNPTTCASCHTVQGWCPALDGIHAEAAFPIERGAHRGVACLDCHVPELGPSTDGINVSCIGCHTGEHSMQRMADQHHEEDDYQWQPARPAFCRDCHPRGRGDD